MPTEPQPRRNCASCGVTACFDPSCEPEAVAAADVFVALAPPAFYAVLLLKKTSSWMLVLHAMLRNKGEHGTWVYNVLSAAVRRNERIKAAFMYGNFTGWPELDAALRLGGYGAMVDVVATMIPERRA